MLLRVLVALASGVVLALAFEPVAVPVVIPFAVAGFVLSCRGLRARRALLAGLAFGVGFEFVLLFWMRTVGPDAWVGLSVWQSLFFAVLVLSFEALDASAMPTARARINWNRNPTATCRRGSVMAMAADAGEL